MRKPGSTWRCSLGAQRKRDLIHAVCAGQLAQAARYAAWRDAEGEAGATGEAGGVAWIFGGWEGLNRRGTQRTQGGEIIILFSLPCVLCVLCGST